MNISELKETESKEYQYLSDKYTFIFTVVSVNKNRVFIILEENSQITQISTTEMINGFKNKLLTEI